MTLLLIDHAVTEPFAIEYAVIGVYEHSVSVAVTALVTSVPDIAVGPIIDSVTMALAVVELAYVDIAVGICLLLERIGRDGVLLVGHERIYQARIALFLSGTDVTRAVTATDTECS